MPDLLQFEFLIGCNANFQSFGKEKWQKYENSSSRPEKVNPCVKMCISVNRGDL